LPDDGIRWRNVLTLESEPIKDGYAYPGRLPDPGPLPAR
jgi:hypothetical protein